VQPYPQGHSNLVGREAHPWRGAHNGHHLVDRTLQILRTDALHPQHKQQKQARKQGQRLAVMYPFG